MHFVSADTQQAKYTTREICIESVIDELKWMVSRCAKVQNKLNQELFFNINKLLLDYCIPEFVIDCYATVRCTVR